METTKAVVFSNNQDDAEFVVEKIDQLLMNVLRGR